MVWSNRAACYLRLGKFEKALQDAQIARTLDPKYVKVRPLRPAPAICVNRMCCTPELSRSQQLAACESGAMVAWGLLCPDQRLLGPCLTRSDSLPTPAALPAFLVQPAAARPLPLVAPCTT